MFISEVYCPVKLYEEKENHSQGRSFAKVLEWECKAAELTAELSQRQKMKTVYKKRHRCHRWILQGIRGLCSCHTAQLQRHLHYIFKTDICPCRSHSQFVPPSKWSTKHLHQIPEAVSEFPFLPSLSRVSDAGQWWYWSAVSHQAR